MLAFLLCLGLFVLWTASGYALLRLLDPTRNRLQRLFLAPPFGVVLTVIPVFVFNRFGIPCSKLGIPIAIGLTLMAIFGIIWDHRRPPVGVLPMSSRGRVWLRYLPFAVILLGALVLSGRPMFSYGFDWLSYCNDDMMNYTLAAQRFLHHGFFELPTADSLAKGLDISQNFWFMHARDGQRPGMELIVAWAAGLTNRSVHDVFMPVIVAMHVGLVSVATGAIYRSRRRYGMAIATAILMATSALSTFGAMYQLIAQVGGLGILCVSTVLVLRPFHTMTRKVAWRYGVLLGILATGFLIIYPEASPFLGLSFFIYQGVLLVRHGRIAWKPLSILVGLTIAATLAIMGMQIFNTIGFLFSQMQVGNSGIEIQVKLFPFYVLPSGFGNLWNLQRVASLPEEPWMSLTIGMGIALSLFVIVVSAVWTLKREPIAVMTLFMFIMAVQLFSGWRAFGLYKLAMFLQPFMLGTFVIGIWWLVRWKEARWVPILALAGASLWVQGSYVKESRGAGTFAEIRNASELGLTSRFREVLREAKPSSLVIDSSNISLAKLQSVYTAGIETAFPSSMYMRDMRRVDLKERLREPELVAKSKEILKIVRKREKEGVFDFHQGNRRAVVPYNTLGMEGGDPASSQYLLAAGGNLTILNRFHYPPSSSTPFIIKPMSNVQNHIIFTYTEFGRPYYGGMDLNDDNMSFFQVENDPMIAGGLFVGVGRYLMFEIIKPTPGARVLVDMTATLKSDSRNALPPAEIVGESRVRLPLLGGGGARVVSEPITTQVIDGRHFVMLDMGVWGTLFPFNRTGLMKWWGDKVLYDRRKLVAFARDISVISDEEYRALQAPQSLTEFPRDLANTQLEYSGLYEKDGWISAACYAMLDPKAANTVTVKGEVPYVGDQAFAANVTLLLDGKVVAEKLVPWGPLELTAPVPPGVGRRKVELRIDRSQHLPAPDNRPVGARLTFIGFETK